MSKDLPKPKRVDVSVGGVTYHLSANENEDYIKQTADKADKALRDLMIRNPSLSGMQATILLVINLMDNLNKLSSEYDALLAENERATAERDLCSKELFVQRDVNFEIKKELLRVNELNKQLMLEHTADDPSLEAGTEETDGPTDTARSNQTTLDEYLSNSL